MINLVQKFNENFLSDYLGAQISWKFGEKMWSQKGKNSM